MNHHRLNLDFEADAIARAARKKCQVRLAKFAVLPLLLLAFWFAIPNFVGNQPSQITEKESAISTPEAVSKIQVIPNPQIAQKSKKEVSAPATTIIESEDELLAILEEFGPVITQKPDGSSYLILTATGP